MCSLNIYIQSKFCSHMMADRYMLEEDQETTVLLMIDNNSRRGIGVNLLDPNKADVQQHLKTNNIYSSKRFLNQCPLHLM